LVSDQALTVSKDLTDRAVIVTASGEVDMLNVDQLRSVVVQALREGPGRPVVVDLTNVTYLGSHGLTALVTAAVEAQHQDEPLRIVVDHQRQVIQPLQLTGLDKVLALYESVEDAISGRTRYSV
jgi:anti-sigma B factor antagonist